MGNYRYLLENAQASSNSAICEAIRAAGTRDPRDVGHVPSCAIIRNSGSSYWRMGIKIWVRPLNVPISVDLAS